MKAMQNIKFKKEMNYIQLIQNIQVINLYHNNYILGYVGHISFR